jgi:hypothetical protein
MVNLMFSNPRQKAGTYAQHETELRNGVTVVSALESEEKFSNTSRQPAASLATEGLSKKPMPVVMRRIC